MVTIPSLPTPEFPGIVDEGSAPTASNSKPVYFAFAFFGLTRPDDASLNNLTKFTEAQFAGYKAQGVSRPEIGPYEALGRALVHDGSFEGRYGALVDTAFAARAYSEIFERPATAAQVAHFESQIAYFKGLYVNAGIASPEASLLAKGAVAGQMLGFAALDENAKTPTAPTGFDFF